MIEETRIDHCNQLIADIATDLADAYLQDGDFLSLYLGQISIALQLSLFQPLVFELSVLLVHLLKAENRELSNMLHADIKEAVQDMDSDGRMGIEERLDCYETHEDLLSCFTGFCQEIVEADAHRLNIEMNEKPIHPDINDRRYVAICEAVARLKQIVHDSSADDL